MNLKFVEQNHKHNRLPNLKVINKLYFKTYNYLYIYKNSCYALLFAVHSNASNVDS